MSIDPTLLQLGVGGTAAILVLREAGGIINSVKRNGRDGDVVQLLTRMATIQEQQVRIIEEMARQTGDLHREVCKP